MTDSLWERTERAVEAIRVHDSREPAIALVLGSGLGAYADELENKKVIPYGEIPGFPVSTVSGHAGALVIGEVDGLPVVAMQGRVHLYEGHDAKTVTFPLRVLWRLGARSLIVTNSAGSLNPNLKPGDLVILKDHINLQGQNPLTGENDERFGPRFPDMTTTYNREYRKLARSVAKKAGIKLKKGIYAGLPGPTYETPAEVRMVYRMGGDLVGMSTVCEAIVARHMGMRILGITCVSNLAAGISNKPLNHAEVEETATKAAATFRKVVDGVVRRLAKEDKKS